MATATLAPHASRKMAWAGWVVTVLPAALLLMGGVMNVLGTEQAREGFKEFGYQEGHLFIIGAVKLACTVLYLIPQTSVLGAILLTGYLGGATATHVRVGDPFFVPPVVFGMLIWLGLYLRDARLRALLPLRR